MTIEIITDENYEEFKKYEKAVLVIGVNSCAACSLYDVVIKNVADSFPDIKFGKAIYDEPDSRSIKRDYPLDKAPHTILLKRGELVSKLVGMHFQPQLTLALKENFS